MFSVFQALAWAEQQKYGNPLEKLIMLRICSASAREGNEVNNWFLPLEFSDLAAYCFASPGACADAMEELQRRGLLVIGASGKFGVEIALPWWIVSHEFTTPESLKEYGQDFRTIAIKCQDGRCWYCGEQFGADTPHKEHQIPRVHGGQDIIENLVYACAPCNLSKGAKTVTEFRAVRAGQVGRKDFRFWGESR